MANDNKWSRYIDYLRKWADSHSGAGFAGMSPACYDEWLDTEYADEEAQYD